MLRSLRLSPVAVLLLALAVPSTGQAAQPVVPNAGFDRWAGETVTGAPVPSQPLLPEGWTFEGSTLLFDHTTNRHVGQPGTPAACANANSKAAAAISGSYSGKRTIILEGQEIDNPTNPVKDATHPVFSLPPVWRTAVPVAITGGKTYTFSVCTSQSVITEDPAFGAVTFIRWVNSAGVTLSVAAGPKRSWRSGDSATLATPWEKITKTNMVAPSGATGAILMLGHADDVNFGQVIYDSVSLVCTNC